MKNKDAPKGSTMVYVRASELSKTEKALNRSGYTFQTATAYTDKSRSGGELIYRAIFVKK